MKISFFNWKKTRCDSQYFALIILAFLIQPGIAETISSVDIVDYVQEKFDVPGFLNPPNILYSSNIPRNVDEHNWLVEEWLKVANEAYRRLQHVGALLDWEYNTNLTQENARRLLDYGIWRKSYMKPWRFQANLFRVEILPVTLARQMKIFRRGQNEMPEEKSREMLRLHHDLQRMYSAGKVCLKNGTCLSGEPDMSTLMETSRDPDQLLWAWKAWRDAVGPAMKPLYFRFINLQNDLARTVGAHDMGESWRREFGENNFEWMCEQLYLSIRPLYEHLHAYVRRKLAIFYGPKHVNLTGPISSHMLGNMWAQDWSSLMDIVIPYPDHSVVDVTPKMKQSNFTAITMFRMAEDFFMSIGLEPMTKKFWKNSVFTKPKDGRDITCHASATNFFDEEDYRIRICSQVTMDNLKTIHHEMGHVEYYMQYRHQPVVFQDGANSAFHEAIGDTVQYSFLTPEHLRDIGLLSKLPSTPEEDINFLMKQALTKIPLIPFSLVIDKWRWEMFKEGTDGFSTANQRWWELSLKYHGVKPPISRDKDDFDAGAKFHIPDNTPFIRYFLGSFIQVQFHQALCQSEYNNPPPLHRCSIYGSKKAGNVLKSAMSLGSSKPWREVMTLLTGQSRILPDAVLKYYRPLLKWLQHENRRNGDIVGWETRN
ncbi:hypothetical protein CHUAL_000760 [Chamberlinius hualienensis]